MLYTESMANVGTEQGSSKDQWSRWNSDSSRPISTLDEMCDVVHLLCGDSPLDGSCSELGFNIGLWKSPLESFGEDFCDPYSTSDSNRNIDQLSQDLSDSDGLTLLNPNAVMPRMPLRFSTPHNEKQVEETTVPVAEDGGNEESEPEGETVTESEADPAENDSDNDDEESNENENEESEREHSEPEYENGSLTDEDEEEEEEEEDEIEEQEEHENAAPQALTPLGVQASTSIMPSVNTEVNATSSSSPTTTTIQLMKVQRLSVAPVVHHAQVSQPNASQGSQHVVYHVGPGTPTTTATAAMMTTVATAAEHVQQEPTGRHNNPYPKPSFSYSCLITLALKNSQTGSLPVSEIYNFMCQHFPYFKTAASGWKNSVRHNLSLNKSFQKIEKPPGNGSQRKGCLWAIRPSRAKKMYEEVQKRLRKDPISIRLAMVHPEHLEVLERGEMKFVDGHDTMQEETESYAEGSVASVGSVGSAGSGIELGGNQNIAYEEEDEEEDEGTTSQEHDAASSLADGGYQEVPDTQEMPDNHEEEDSEAGVVVEQLYNELDIESFPSADQITLPYLYQLSPNPKKRKLGNSGSTQSSRVIFQVQEDTSRRKVPVQSQLGSSSPRYVLVNIDEV